MTLLDAERPHAPEAPAQTPPEVPEQPSAAGTAPACANCGAPLVAEQEWCLNCGAAVAGPVSGRAGWRAFSTIAVLTLVLVLGAVAASYAALSSHKRKPAVVAAPPAQVAQTPPAAAPAAPTTSTPAATPKAGKPKALPKVKAPSTAPSAGATPVTPTPSSTPKTTAPSTPSSSKPTTTKTPAKTTTPKPTAPVALKLDPGAGSTYDPYGKAAATGDPAKALDGDPSTSWYIDPTAADGPIGAGYAINLGAQKAVKRIQLTTTTPGFRVEVYATDEASPPPDISDTRWSHITNVSKVGASSGTQTIVVGGGTSKYQTVLLWITDRPSDGARVRISELKLFG